VSAPSPDRMPDNTGHENHREPETLDRAPRSSFLQMFLEARPPREESRSTD